MCKVRLCCGATMGIHSSKVKMHEGCLPGAAKRDEESTDEGNPMAKRSRSHSVEEATESSNNSPDYTNTNSSFGNFGQAKRKRAQEDDHHSGFNFGSVSSFTGVTSANNSSSSSVSSSWNEGGVDTDVDMN